MLLKGIYSLKLIYYHDINLISIIVVSQLDIYVNLYVTYT